MQTSMNYADAIRPIRNRLRKFSYVSVLGELSRFIWEESNRTTGVPRAPWLAERVAVWVLRDNPRAYGAEPIPRSALNSCLNDAWKMMDVVSPKFGPNQSFHLAVRSILLAQAPHQRPQEFASFARQIDLINRLEKSSHLYCLFEQEMGMPPSDYLAIATLFRKHALEDISRVLDVDYRAGLMGIFGRASVERFYDGILVPREKTAEQMQEIAADEWFQPNLLYRSPFTVLDKKVWFFWGRCGLDRNLGFVLSDIVGRSKSSAVRQTFETMFEDYVGRTLARVDAEVLGEKAIKKRFSVEGPCCDFAVIDGDQIVLIEVKNKALTHTLPASGTARDYQSKLSATVKKAEVQLRNTESYVRRAVPSASVHKVVITYGDLLVSETDQLFTVRADQFESTDHVCILSVDHLDLLAEAARLKQCRFGAFFEDYARRRHIPAQRVLLISDLLKEKPYTVPPLPQHLFDVYTPFLEKLMRRTQGCTTA